MKLYIDFDDDLMRKYHGRGASPLFAIYWTDGAQAYPEEGWLDFGSVVLSWWLVATQQLLAGTSAVEFMFMDGPFELNVLPINNLARVTSIESDISWKMPTTTFVREILQAAERTANKLAELEIPDETGLAVGISKVKIALSEQQRRRSDQEHWQPVTH